ncbi:insulinase family protein [Rhodocaloribacter litoris]|uniref:M16 family metallopeptidase n=1 Tax=Rhodocaloribacter litoris TaxID=2558931 RepID=UPI001420464F|nr:pitrilysin family protein [Rhodocaloribacter litoris]QXD14686.1 insulinase family protein [Rhodocaloribacter litoris]GIV59226.1 MAG: protease [Rhodothermaceae bacterium]
MQLSETAQVLPEDVTEAFAFVEASGGIEAYRLRSNNLHVLLLPEAAAPVVTFMVTYRVGSRNETTGLTGATHFLEHLMFKGTERFSKERGTSIFNVLQRVGAQVNATTWLDRTNYYALLPREHLALAVEIEADRMRNARIREEDLESERTVILNELDRGENEPLRKLYHAVWSTAFMAHPYHHPTIGWRSDVEHVSAEGLRHFYDTFYWPDNATVSIIGDFDRSEALRLVHRHFGPIPPAPAPVPEVYTREPEQRGERCIVVRQAGRLGAVMVAFKSPPALDPDADALDVLATALATGKNSRLYRHLTDRGLTTHLYANASRLRDPGLFFILAMLAPDQTHAGVEAAIEEVLDTVRRDGLTETELARAKNQLRAREAFSRDGPYAVATQLNEAIAAGDWKLYTTYLDRIERVTATDVRRVAQAYLVEDRRTVGRYVPIPDSPTADA